MITLHKRFWNVSLGLEETAEKQQEDRGCLLYTLFVDHEACFCAHIAEDLILQDVLNSIFDLLVIVVSWWQRR